MYLFQFENPLDRLIVQGIFMEAFDRFYLVVSNCGTENSQLTHMSKC